MKTVLINLEDCIGIYSLNARIGSFLLPVQVDWAPATLGLFTSWTDAVRSWHGCCVATWHSPSLGSSPQGALDRMLAPPRIVLVPATCHHWSTDCTRYPDGALTPLGPYAFLGYILSLLLCQKSNKCFHPKRSHGSFHQLASWQQLHFCL